MDTEPETVDKHATGKTEDDIKTVAKQMNNLQIENEPSPSQSSKQIQQTSASGAVNVDGKAAYDDPSVQTKLKMLQHHKNAMGNFQDVESYFQSVGRPDMLQMCREVIKEVKQVQETRVAELEQMESRLVDLKQSEIEQTENRILELQSRLNEANKRIAQLEEQNRKQMLSGQLNGNKTVNEASPKGGVSKEEKSK